MNTGLKSSPPASAPGFSLVEVTLAVAIAALAIITFLGLLPQGLEISRKTAQLTLYSNVLEQIVRDIDNASWDTLPTGNNERRFFDDQGVEVTSASDRISIVAQMDFSQTTSLSSANDQQRFLKRVVVNLATTPNATYEFTPSAKNFSYSSFHHLVSKSRSATP